MHTGTRIILATVTPRPGALDKIIELYQPIIKDGQSKEDGCFEFQLFTEVDPDSGVEQLFTIERFKNIEALRLHQQGSALVAFNKASAEQDLLEKPIMVKVVKSVSGFHV